MPRSAWSLPVLAALLAFGCQHATPAPSPSTPSTSAAAASPDGATSFAKIDAAASAGRIDADTALLYRLYAYEAPDRLPAELHGADRGGPAESTMLLATIGARRARMKADVRAKIEPFFTRPTEPASFWAPPAAKTAARAPREDTRDPRARKAKDDSPPPPVSVPGSAWSALDTAEGHLRIWYETAAGPAKAASLRASLDGSDVWATEKAVMGREPCSDAALTKGTSDNGTSPNGSVGPNDPGAGRLDIYLLPPAQELRRDVRRGGLGEVLGWGAGRTIWESPCTDREQKGNMGSAYILLDATGEPDVLASDAAHEIFHAFQEAFPGLSKSFAEASATWAEDLVYPRSNREQDFLQTFCRESAFQQQWVTGPLDVFADQTFLQYSAYVWPFFLTRIAGHDLGLVGRIWEAMPESTYEHDEVLVAMKRALGDDGLRQAFKAFALANWNDDADDARKYRDYLGSALAPMDKSLISEKTDKPVTVVTKPDPASDNPFTVQIEGRIFDPTSATYFRGGPLGHTEAAYFEVDVSDGVGAFVPQVSFDLSGVAEKPDVSVQAIAVTAAGGFVQDWTGSSERRFCRDDPGEKVTRVILVVANAAIDDATPVRETIRVTAKGECAHQGNLTYGATATWQLGQSSDPLCARANTGTSTTAGGSATYTERATSQWSLTTTADVTDPRTNVRTITYAIDSGNRITLQGSGESALSQKISGPGFSSSEETHAHASSAADGGSCNGSPPSPTSSGPTYACRSDHTTASQAAGYQGGRGGQPGFLQVHVPPHGPATYQIDWTSEVVPMRESCGDDTVSEKTDPGRPAQRHTTSRSYDARTNAIHYLDDGKERSDAQRGQPGAYVALSASGTFTPDATGGDIEVTQNKSSAECGAGILTVYDGCDYAGHASYTSTTSAGACITCTSSSEVHLRIHVPFAPASATPSSPPPAPSSGPPAASGDPCADFAACCASIAPEAKAAAGVACAQILGSKVPLICSNALAAFRGKRLCR